ncbi:MAG: hypothetical protein R2863_10780 [Candidatus Kapaibacterium sp.]|nr:hypothetical protein [Ignavibacteriota bacterium]MCB9221864.1 hypothetical protein [Ignavibacteria bacterium]
MRLNSTDNQITRIYNNNSEGIASKSRVNKTNSPQKQKLEEFNDKVNQPDTILSDNEKNFFKKMFPESSASLDRHIVFNRNGKVQSKTFALGTMLDAKV